MILSDVVAASEPEEHWDIETAIQQAAPVLWRYAGSSAAILSGTDPDEVKALLPADLQRLVACHLISLGSAFDLVGVTERLLRKLPASVGRQRETYRGHVRGRIDWPRTANGRVASADPTLFVCEPIDRRYDTPLGRLLKLCLVCLSQLPAAAGYRDQSSTSQLAQRSFDMAQESQRLVRHPKLRQVRLVERNLLRHLPQTVEREPEVEHVARFVDLFYRGISLADSAALRDLLAQQYFSPRASSLFELLVGLRVLEALELNGYVLNAPLSVLPAAGVPFAEMTNGNGSCRVWWQRAAWPALEVKQTEGRWTKVLVENRISNRQPLMPDLLIEFPHVQRLILVEVKLTEVGAQRERDGLRDVLAYLSDLEHAGADPDHLQALVVAWNATGLPLSVGQQVLVTSQKRVLDDVAALVRSVA